MTPGARRPLALLGPFASFAVAAWSLLVAAPAFAVAPLVNATLQPSRIAMGESAELAISTSGTSMVPVALPTVAGLEFRVVGQSHRVSIVGGATLVTTALIVRVTPNAVGTYTIAGFTPPSQPLVLRVDPEGTGAGSRVGALPGAGGAGEGHGDAIRYSPDGSAFLRLVLPKKELYVGESVPVQIEVGLRDGFVKSLNGLPTLSGQDFTLNNLSHQPERVQKVIDGKPFTVVTWRSVLAAVKPGQFSLSVKTPLTVRIRTRPQRDSTLEDALGDPFLQNYYGATVQKDITVESPPAELEVLALPAAGRPPDFSGAVGSFSIAGELAAAGAAAGDPLTLRMRVLGTGNFDRVDSGMLAHLDGWKTYPPKSTFKAMDPLGVKGEKVFEQPLIAARPGTQSLPPLEFSYFDPAARRYVTLRSTPLRVTIGDSSADRSLRAPATAAVDAAVETPGLRPDHADRGPNSSSLVPPYLRPGYLAGTSLFWVACALGWYGSRRRNAARGRDSRRLPEALARQLAAVEAAARGGNPRGFFTAARAALATAVGDSLDTESDEVRQLFALADEAIYSDHMPEAPEFEHWSGVVRRRLAAGAAR